MIQTTNMLTVAEVGKMLRLSKNTTYKLINQNGFPKITIGRKILIPEDRLEKYLNKHIGNKIMID